MRRRGRVWWCLWGVLLLGCDAGDGDGATTATGETETSETSGTPEDLPAADCFDHADEGACAAGGCTWMPAIRIQATDPTCEVAEPTPMCLPQLEDGADPTCIAAIPGCTEPGPDKPPGTLSQPAYLVHPDGGWVVVESCGAIVPIGVTVCSDATASGLPVCQCACA